jgi:hypothetical protein
MPHQAARALVPATTRARLHPHRIEQADRPTHHVAAAPPILLPAHVCHHRSLISLLCPPTKRNFPFLPHGHASALPLATPDAATIEDPPRSHPDHRSLYAASQTKQETIPVAIPARSHQSMQMLSASMGTSPMAAHLRPSAALTQPAQVAPRAAQLIGPRSDPIGLVSVPPAAVLFENPPLSTSSRAATFVQEQAPLSPSQDSHRHLTAS